MASLNPEKISPEAIASERARRGISDKAGGVGSERENGLEGHELMAFYTDPGFKKYVLEKFAVVDPSHLENDTILQMIYALEWYDVPRSVKPDIIEFHPYLNVEDYEKLYYIK